MVSKARAQKVGQRIQEDLAAILQREAGDPRLELVTVTGVDVDRELAYATVYVTRFDASERQGEILAGLNAARGYLRSELASRIELRTFPQLRFRWDPAPDRGARIEELLAELKRDEDRSDDS